MAQYTNKKAIIVFVIFAYFENNSLNAEPNSDQHSVNANPINASNNAKKINTFHWP